MKKILIVAKSEFATAVKSKGFIIGVMLMPILVGISIGVEAFSRKHADVSDRKFAVIDETGEMFEVLALAAADQNRKIAANPDSPRPKFFPVRSQAESRPREEARLELSELIRKGELFAFVEIPPGILDPSRLPPEGTRINYFSDKPTDEDLRTWIATTINGDVLRRRIQARNLSVEDYKRLVTPIDSEHLSLASRAATGEIKGATEVDKARTTFIPMIMMFLLWMVVMSAAPQLLNSAIEEKMIRVSEVILGCVTPFELMMGKLVASAGVSSVLAVLYLGGGTVLAFEMGHPEYIPYWLLPYFVLFMLLAVLFFGSIFIAIGAACTELKDVQGLMAPAMIILMLPIFVWMPVLKDPNGSLAVISSLFPPATPMLMLLRLSTHPTPPAWQVILSIVLTSAATIAGVWAAGKIFRIGILSQGKTPSMRELIRWIRNP